LTDLKRGETGRILRVAIEESGCRKRFAEMGLAEGMKITVAATGETMMLIVGGSRMGVAARCAEAILVSRIPS
jgi:Fe2+ transport system protein FeoA